MNGIFTYALPGALLDHASGFDICGVGVGNVSCGGLVAVGAIRRELGRLAHTLSGLEGVLFHCGTVGDAE